MTSRSFGFNIEAYPSHFAGTAPCGIRGAALRSAGLRLPAGMDQTPILLTNITEPSCSCVNAR